MTTLSTAQCEALTRVLAVLIDQERARVLVPPYANQSGFWFGGGNLVQDDAGVWLCGRYRNFGDSRTGLAAGTRGLECALFHTTDTVSAWNQHSFDKVCSWSKGDLSYAGRKVLSIEGVALHQLPDGSWELFVSSEKELAYPAPVAAYQKAGTGVWSIDCMTGPSPDQLDPSTLTPVLEGFTCPEYLHVKDPVVFDDRQGNTFLIFCSHPFSWASSNTGVAMRKAGESSFNVQTWEMVARGAAWDVAATRVTARLQIPKLGLFAGQPTGSVYFYDGAESLRQLEENKRAKSRPRGYSCEEIGGALFGWDAAFPQTERLSRLTPLFVSPHGTGASRYVDVLATAAGLVAVWEQSQADESQPLVGHFLPMAQVKQILGG